MNCLVIEDQVPAQRILKKYIAEDENLLLTEVFADARDALRFLETHVVDLIFLDIHLPGMSGIEFLKQLKNKPAVIITTAFSEFAVQSYDWDVADYLVKPISPGRFKKAVQRVFKKVAEKNTHRLFVKTGHSYVQVESRQVCYIKTDMDYTELHVHNKKLLSAETLQHWQKKLVDYNFVRVHKSYLVNTQHILHVKGNAIHLKNNTEIPIGRAYKDAFLKHLQIK